MKGGGDPDNRRDFPGGFPADERDAFVREGRTAEEQSVFEHLQRVIRLRRELEPLRRGTLINLFASEQQYIYGRVSGRESVIVVINNDSRETMVEFGVESTSLGEGAVLTDRLGAGGEAQVRGGKVKVSLPARSAAILVRN
jgi:glycosidase